MDATPSDRLGTDHVASTLYFSKSRLSASRQIILGARKIPFSRVDII